MRKNSSICLRCHSRQRDVAAPPSDVGHRLHNRSDFIRAVTVRKRRHGARREGQRGTTNSGLKGSAKNSLMSMRIDDVDMHKDTGIQLIQAKDYYFPFINRHAWTFRPYSLNYGMLRSVSFLRKWNSWWFGIAPVNVWRIQLMKQICCNTKVQERTDMEMQWIVPSFNPQRHVCQFQSFKGV